MTEISIMTKQPAPSSRLMSAMHHAVLTALAAALSGQLYKKQIAQDIVARVYTERFSIHQRWAQLELAATHPPHVLVSAKVLLQSRRAKGGFSFGTEASRA